MKQYKSLYTFVGTLILSILFSTSLVAIPGVQLDEDCRISRFRVSEERLDNNVVFICVWSANDKNSIAILPRVQKYWEAFKSKPFIVVGSHLGPTSDDLKAARILERLKISFPVYKTASASDTPPKFSQLPYFIVLNGEKKIIYSGKSDLTAIETAQNEMINLITPGKRRPAIVPRKTVATVKKARPEIKSLIAGVELDRYKSAANQLVLGKNIRSTIQRIKSEKERYPNAKFAAEADAILSAVQEAKKTYLDEIYRMKSNSDPKTTLKALMDYARTFPDTIESLRPLYNELKAK
jgi:hypothetical protein